MKINRSIVLLGILSIFIFILISVFVAGQENITEEDKASEGLNGNVDLENGSIENVVEKEEESNISIRNEEEVVRGEAEEEITQKESEDKVKEEFMNYIIEFNSPPLLENFGARSLPKKDVSGNVIQGFAVEQNILSEYETELKEEHSFALADIENRLNAPEQPLIVGMFNAIFV